MEDAEYAIITFGCSTRSAKAAMKAARAQGKKVGVVQLVTVWPFPDQLVADVCGRVKEALPVPELNPGPAHRRGAAGRLPRRPCGRRQQVGQRPYHA
ncbi:MAG: transketolase C-terminal domain-containing protein [Dysosmobacter sp.]